MTPNILFFPLISALEELRIKEYQPFKDGMENAQLLELLDPFTALKDLYLIEEIARCICGALQELSGERSTEVLPALHNIFIVGFRSSGYIQEAIRPFVSARQLSGYPVVVDSWKY